MKILDQFEVSCLISIKVIALNRITLLFCIYGTRNQHLKIVEAETDKTMSQPDFTAQVYILPRNQNACIPSTQLCIHALKSEGKKSLWKVYVQRIEWSYYTEAKADISGNDHHFFCASFKAWLANVTRSCTPIIPNPT
jgi:hypothetical protein